MALSDKCILLIDDDEDILVLAKRILEGAGMVCYTSTTIREGLMLAVSKIPHVIITDLQMPQVDGYVFLEKKTAYSPN